MKKKFNESECDIPTIWCGDSDKPPTKRKDGNVYVRTGTRFECMKKGFGAGTHIERKSNLPSNSLQQIKYVGEKHEKGFKKSGISNTDALTKAMSKKNSAEIEAMLKKVLTKSDGKVDYKAYNCTILWLYRHGIGGEKLPACKKI